MRQPRRDAGVRNPAQMGGGHRTQAIQWPSGRQQPALRCRPCACRQADTRTDPLRRCLHRNGGTLRTAACQLDPGLPARRRDQIHPGLPPTGTVHGDGHVRSLAPDDSPLSRIQSTLARHLRRARRGAATIHVGMPAALAVQGIRSHGGRTIHVHILFKAPGAAVHTTVGNQGGTGSSRHAPPRGLPLNQVCGVDSRPRHPTVLESHAPWPRNQVRRANAIVGPPTIPWIPA